MARMLGSLILLAALILCGQSVQAGVVLSETEVQIGPDGFAMLSKTVYVQGRKQKIETPGNQTIIDLDKGLIYVVYPNRKSYAEISFVPKKDHGTEGALELNAVALRKTGRSHWIDGYSCDEYQATTKLAFLDLKINQCISKDAPGVTEVAAFQKALLSKLMVQGPKVSGDTGKAGVPLEERSTVRARLPEASSRENATNAQVMMTQTRVKNIRVRSLPPATFEPPAGFRREAPPNERKLEV